MLLSSDGAPLDPQAADGLLDEPLNLETLAAGCAKLRDGADRAVVRLEQASERPLFGVIVRIQAMAASMVREPPVGAYAVLVLPAPDDASALWASVRESFGLTHAEMRLAQRLKAGRSLKQAAEETGVSVNTVRFQLRAIFDKVGVSRQSDLILALTDLGRAASTPYSQRRVSAAGYPAPPHRFFRTSDGRRLAYREYGDPRGRPAVLLHEGLGSSLAVAGCHEHACAVGLRLVIPDRPGFGLSDPSPRYSFQAVGADVADLARALGMSRPRIAGILSGAPFALAAAAALGEDVDHVLLISGRPPMRPPFRLGNPLRTFRERLLLNPWVYRQLLESMRLRVDRAFVERALRQAARAPVDRAALSSEFVAYGLALYRDVLALGARGPVDEIRCFASAKPCPIPDAPIRAWHGGEDHIAPFVDLRAFLGERLSEVRMFEGSGHLLALTHWREVLSELAA